MKLNNTLAFLILMLIFFKPIYALAQVTPRYNRVLNGPSTVYNPYRRGFVLDFGYFYFSEEKSTQPSSGADGSTQYSNLDFKLGYLNQASFYWGGAYSIKNDLLFTNRAQGRGSGVGLGYFWNNGFDLRGYYRFQESYGEYTSGNGYQICLTYSSKLSQMVNLGFTVDYREIKYLDYSQDPAMDYHLIKKLNPSVTMSIYFE